MVVKMSIPGSRSRLKFVNHLETYGPSVIEKITRNIRPRTCLDIGAGRGRDLAIVKKNCNPDMMLAVDYRPDSSNLLELGSQVLALDIERDEIPVPDCSMDLIIANQTMEHVKEIYWINHQVFKKLSVGGYFVMGVPNLLSLHNRFMAFLGMHPTCIKMISAHIRGYSVGDTRFFYECIGSRFLLIEHVYGSQFYPLPVCASRVASRLFPGLATSIFFVIRKTQPYQDEFINWLQPNHLETNYFLG